MGRDLIFGAGVAEFLMMMYLVSVSYRLFSRVSSQLARQLRAESGPGGIIFQRSRAGGIGNAALDREKDDGDFVPCATATTLTAALAQVRDLEGGQ